MNLFEIKSNGGTDCWVVAKNSVDATVEARTSTELDIDGETDIEVIPLPSSSWDKLTVSDSTGPDEIIEGTKRTFREDHAENPDRPIPYIIAHSMEKY